MTDSQYFAPVADDGDRPAWLVALEDRERRHAASGNEIDRHYAAGIRDAMTEYTLAAAQAPAVGALTEAQIAEGLRQYRQQSGHRRHGDAFRAGVEFAERAHGIGKADPPVQGSQS